MWLNSELFARNDDDAVWDNFLSSFYADKVVNYWRIYFLKVKLPIGSTNRPLLITSTSSSSHNQSWEDFHVFSTFLVSRRDLTIVNNERPLSRYFSFLSFILICRLRCETLFNVKVCLENFIILDWSQLADEKEKKKLCAWWRWVGQWRRLQRNVEPWSKF